MQPRLSSALVLTVFATIAGSAFAQRPNIGIAAVKVKDTPYVFDTAEQHGIRVSVVVRGLPHPFSFAFLPNGDALVAERGGGLRLVRNAASGKGGAATLEPKPISGAPEPSTARGGGLQDVVLHPQFARNSLVYFTYNKIGDEIPNSTPPRRQAALALALLNQLKILSMRKVLDILLI